MSAQNRKFGRRFAPPVVPSRRATVGRFTFYAPIATFDGSEPIGGRDG